MHICPHHPRKKLKRRDARNKGYCLEEENRFHYCNFLVFISEGKKGSASLKEYVGIYSSQGPNDMYLILQKKRKKSRYIIFRPYNNSGVLKNLTSVKRVFNACMSYNTMLMKTFETHSLTFFTVPYALVSLYYSHFPKLSSYPFFCQRYPLCLTQTLHTPL